MTMLKRFEAVLGTLLSLAITTQAFALGGGANIGNEVPSARAAGQGFVGVAGQNEDPIVVYSNPGGLTALKGTQVTAGIAWENLHGNYKGDVAGSDAKMRVVDAAVPNAAFTHSFMDGKMAAGLAIISPYGLETHFAGDSPLRYVATDTRLHLAILTPAIAYKVHDMVSVGLGVDYVNAFDASLEKKVSVDVVNTAAGFPTSGAPDANSRLKGSGDSWGYHAGVVVQPNEKHAFGVTYHSKIKLTIDGSVELKGLSGASTVVFGGSDYATAAQTTLFLPQNVQFGYAYKPNEKWLLEADTAWYDWYSSRDLNVQYAETNANRLAILNVNNPAPFGLRDTFNVGTGANYKYSDKLQLRTGFWYEAFALPEQNFNPAFMDLSRYGVTVGTGYALTTALSIDLAYNAIFFHNRHIANNVGANSSGIPAGYNINGVYKNFTNLVAVNFSYKFGEGK